jgi:hypothetical protein
MDARHAGSYGMKQGLRRPSGTFEMPDQGIIAHHKMLEVQKMQSIVCAQTALIFANDPLVD